MNGNHRSHLRQTSGDAPPAAAAQSAVAESQSALDFLQDSAGNEAVDGLLSRAPAGEPLDAATRSALGATFGRSLDDVRVHDDGPAHAASRALQAAAFTRGSDVFLGAAAPERGTPAGQWLLAHELAHVVQQRQAPERLPAIGGHHDAHETAADHAADLAVAGRPAPVAAGGPVPAVQRAPIDLKTASRRAAEAVAKEQNPVETAVMAFLEREWTAQSNKEKPLAMSDTIREAMKIVFTDTPTGVAAVATHLQHDPGTPAAFMANIRNRLPASIPPEAMTVLNKLPGPKAQKEPRIEGPSPAKGDKAHEAALKEAARRLLQTEAGQQLAKSTKRVFLSQKGIPFTAILAGGAITFVAANDPKLPAIPEIELGEGIKIQIEYSGRASDLPPLVRQMLGRAPTARGLPTPEEYSLRTAEPEKTGPDEVKVGVKLTVTNEALVKFVKAAGRFFAVVGRGIAKGVVTVGKVIWPWLGAALGGATLGALIGLAIGGGIGAGIGAAIGAGAALLLFGVGKLVQYLTGKKKKKKA
jgi:hypothetical protein